MTTPTAGSARIPLIASPTGAAAIDESVKRLRSTGRCTAPISAFQAKTERNGVHTRRYRLRVWQHRFLLPGNSRARGRQLAEKRYKDFAKVFAFALDMLDF